MSRVRCRFVQVLICLRKCRNVLVSICPSADMSSIQSLWCKATITQRGNNFILGPNPYIHPSDHGLLKKTKIRADVIISYAYHHDMFINQIFVIIMNKTLHNLYIKTTKEDKTKVYAIHMSGEMQPNKIKAVCNTHIRINTTKLNL